MKTASFDSQKLRVSKWEAECPVHGAYAATGAEDVVTGQRLGGACPQCQEERRVAEESSAQAQDARERVLAVERLLARSQLPPRFVGRTLDNFSATLPEQEGVLAECQRYAAEFSAEALATGASLILVGRTGAGKTHLAAGIMQEVMQQGWVALFELASDLLLRFKETYKTSSEQTESALLAHYSAPDLLVLDDVGDQRATLDEMRILNDVLKHRHMAMKPVLLTSNASPQELRSLVGDRGFDRLKEGGGRILACRWASYRPRVHTDSSLPRRMVPPVDWARCGRNG